MTQFICRFTEGGGSTVAQCSVLARSVSGCGQEVGESLLMSADDIYLYIINMQALGVLEISGLIPSLIKLVLTSPA